MRKTKYRIEIDHTPMLKLFRAHVKKGIRMNRVHRHTDFEISLMLSGKGEYTTEHGVYSMQVGDMFLFSTNEQHCITKIESDEMELLTLQFSPRFIWGFGNRMFDFRFLQIFFTHSKSCRLENNTDTRPLQTLLQEMEAEFASGNPESELMVKAHLLKLLVLLIRKYGSVSTETPAPKKQSLANLESAMTYIDNHICDNITLEEAADVAGMSRAYFSTIFKHLNGIGLWDYITLKRIEKAKEILKTSDKTMLEIATLCGYNNTANFNRAFRTVTQKTPREYKKEQKL